MLLADFHVHSTWSDGRLSIPEVVDLFGRTGHDVIAITDHVVNADSLLGKIAHTLPALRHEGQLRRLPRGDRARGAAGLGRLRDARPRGRAS